jgi:hypothetical protein
VRRKDAALLTIVAIGLTAGTGCPPQKTQNTIAQIDPYVGDRPAPLPPLRERPTPRVEPARPQVASGAEPGWLPRSGISNRWQCIVIHHSANDRSTPQSMTDWHVRGRGWDALGYHFVIGNGVGYGDGRVFVGDRWPRQMHGAHCKTPGNHYNEHGIGICLIGDLDDHPPSPRQMQALARLLSFLCQKTGIPPGKIYTHGGVTRKTACPGRRFNLQQVIRQMSAGPLAAGTQ